MRETANASIDFTGVPHLLARPSKGDPNGVVVWSEIQPLVEALATKLSKAELQIEQQKNNAAQIKRFTLTGGVAEIRASVEDGENYTYTTFTIPTGFVDNAGEPTCEFEDFAMSAVLAPYSNEGFRYEFRKELPDLAVIVFQNIAGAFPDDRVRISLIRIPESVSDESTFVLIPTDPLLQDFDTNFHPWADWDNRFGAGSWERLVIGYALINGTPTIKFKNGNTLTRSQVDNYWNNGKDLQAIDSIAGASA